MPLFPSPAALALQAATATAGYTLVNSTGTVITWTTPNDGLLHRFIVNSVLSVTSPETGGNILVNYTLPGTGGAASHTLYGGGLGSGDAIGANAFLIMCKANTAVSVSQSVALSGGAATLWAEIWGS